MKKILLMAALGAAVITGTTSCSKYEDGPVVSLVSRENRISNTWQYESATKDGNDILSDTTIIFTGSRLDFNKNGTLLWNWNNGAIGGAWTFQSNDEEVKLSFPAPMGDKVWTILKLKQDQFWVKYIEDGSTYEFHFVEG